MVDPLHRSPRGAEVLRTGTDPHPGLLFERFPRLLRRHGPRFDIDPGQRAVWLDAFIAIVDRSATAAAVLARHHARLDAACRALGGERRVFETAGRLAIGLGNPNAADIGFSLDHATGLPVLPGSSVKGLARAGSRLEGSTATARTLLGRGPEPQRPQAADTGRIAFLDALPLDAAGLFEVDVITRHHDPEAFGRQETPLEADRPNPVHFLVVRPGVRFAFRMLPLHGATSDDLATAWEWLEAALRDLGAGGKTAVGYGELRPVEEQATGTPTLAANAATVSSSSAPDPAARARELIADLAANNAADRVPRILTLARGTPHETAIAREAIHKLTRRRVRKSAEKGRSWALALLDAGR